MLSSEDGGRSAFAPSEVGLEYVQTLTNYYGGGQMGVASQAPDLHRCENGITLFDCPRDNHELRLEY